MATDAECHEEWRRGYEHGWSVHKTTKPTVPPRPAGFPPDVNALITTIVRDMPAARKTPSVPLQE